MLEKLMSVDSPFSNKQKQSSDVSQSGIDKALGIVAGSSSFPVSVARDAVAMGYRVHSVCFEGEASTELNQISTTTDWIKIGEFGRLIASFKNQNISKVVFAGGIDRPRLFGGVKLDLRGMQLLAKVRSRKDDLIMRGMAKELALEGIDVQPCTLFSHSSMAELGSHSKRKASASELEDIEIGREALLTMGKLHIGQLVVVREGVIVSVEAVEGSDQAILRGGQLGGAGCVVVKCSKPEQDMRFDVPTIGPQTLATLSKAKATVLAVEAGACVILEKKKFLQEASRLGISIIGVPGLPKRN